MSARAAANPRAARAAALCAALLIALCVAWETWLAPLRPGGSALMLKAVPLALALPGVWRRNVYTLQWASMLILIYLAEGIVRGMTDGGLSAWLGWAEAALALGFFGAALVYVAPFKRVAKQAAKQAADPSGQPAAPQPPAPRRPRS
ncbi:DUF2069 domain-containing protein [Burkholderia sp. TSV86]|uniref:DUF2069 domain-containing protein n=1 Tax=Burkholderia sp. TSV86 TaxID=1385594 RepID=UPI000751E9D1|nr:DUF2069 domain-containing protein [Burkholderia sp. TSV86]KVE30995.1 hypothetical protein WS68_17960 [Burkholderia sp. TSV86]